MKKLIILLAAVVMTGCAGIKTYPIHKNPNEVSIYVKHNSKVIFDNKKWDKRLVDDLRDKGFEVYATGDNKPAECCDYELRYSLRRKWDVFLFPARAVVVLYDKHGIPAYGSSFMNYTMFLKFFRPKTMSEWMVDALVAEKPETTFFKTVELYDDMFDFNAKKYYGCGDLCYAKTYQGNLELDY
jgi:hypothetical protein